MPEKTLRVGLVGAGGNTQLRHIPGFQAIDGVKIVSVANRSRESGQRVADEFGIATVYERWEDLVAADDSDAICIGTWPYLHCPVTLAALAAGKHVLCEARMAMNAAEAHQMFDAAQKYPDLVTQVVPSPFSLGVDQTVKELIEGDYLGELLSVDVIGRAAAFVDCDAPMTWRQDIELSGLNVLMMGIFYESLMRWIGPASSVSAVTKIAVPRRDNTAGETQEIRVPDHAEVLAQMECGAVAHLQFSAVTGLARQNSLSLFGSQGTLVFDQADGVLRGARTDDAELAELTISEDKRGSWRVEEEFVGAIRGTEEVKLTSFADGVRYMEFTEAVARSAARGERISLPLK